ncbi:MAG TPA: SurA N-terminal domain-containing protein [Pirellulaceae bacterium]|jgi:hypothetical protein|nr:SurA N-terminal domain-containing protein [Pirellulaceae bacterium]
MASPLSFFRRHMKILLVILTAITVLTFTVGGVVMQFFQGRAPSESFDPEQVVATWDGGTITEGELVRARRRREVVASVLAQIDRMRTERATDSFPKAPQLLLGTSDEQIVLDEVMAERAEEMGIRVTDADVNAYLTLYSDELVSPEEISQTFRKFTGGEMQSSDFFDRMRKELAILQMYLAYQSAQPAVTPAAAWEAYLRSSRQVQAAVVPFPVEDYLAEVKEEPSRADLANYYEKYKTEYRNPLSYEVGFRRPYEAKFGYFHANFEDFLERAKQQVSDGEVRAAYEEAIARGEFRELDLPSVDEDPLPLPGEGATPPAGDTPPGDTPLPPAETVPPAEPAPGDSSPESTTPESDPAPEGESPEGTTPEGSMPEESSAESPAGEDAPGEPATPIEEVPGESTPPAETPEENASLTVADDRLFVVLQEEEGQPANEQPSDDAPESGTPAIEEASPEAPAGDMPAEGTLAGDESATDDPAATPAPPSGAVIVGSPDPNGQAPAPPGAAASVSGTTPSGTTPAAGAPAAGAPAADATSPPKFKPFEEVADDLRLRLARPISQQAMMQAVQKASDQIDEYARRLAVASATDETLPARPNFRHIASTLGLKYAETPSINAFATRTDEGKPYYPLITAREMDFTQPMQGQQFNYKTFAQAAFVPGAPLFEPTTLFVENRFNPSDAYVFWKTEQHPAEVPPLEEIRDEVVQAWKLEKARELAKAAAEKAAQEANAKAASLKPNAEGARESALTALYPKKAKNAGQFTFLPHQFDPTAGEIANVENAGPELRQAIFTLREGEVSYGPNADRSVYYLVEVTKDMQPPAQTVDRFLAVPNQFLMQMIQPSLMGERQNFQFEVFREMTDQVDLEWKRPPAEQNARR